MKKALTSVNNTTLFGPKIKRLHTALWFRNKRDIRIKKDVKLHIIGLSIANPRFIADKSRTCGR